MQERLLSAGQRRLQVISEQQDAKQLHALKD